jgi:drug/metabolite transporter (DMT)-like permease
MNDAARRAARSDLSAEAALVLVSLLWGVSFPLMKHWQNAAKECPGGGLLSGVTLIALRMALALALVALFTPRLLRGATRREHLAGAAVGLAFGSGFALQTWGLAFTTPSRSAFFTSLCSAWTPVVGWLFLRLRVRPLTLAGLALGVIGAAFFVEDEWRLGFGETLTLVASLFFVGQILLLDRLGRGIDSSRMTPAFFLTTALIALAVGESVALSSCGNIAWVSWVRGMLADWSVVLAVIVLGLFPTFLAFQLMNRFQPRVSANRAALIYLLEPVFTAIISVSLGMEALTWALVLGGGFILTGNILVEAAGWFRRTEAAR